MAETLAGIQESRWHVTRRGRKQGGKSKKEGEDGDSWKDGRMGVSSPLLSPCSESGKSQSSEGRNRRSPFHVDKICVSMVPSTDQARRGKTHFFSSLVDFFGKGAPNTSTLARELWRSQSKVTSRSGVSPGCLHWGICWEPFSKTIEQECVEPSY